MPVTQRAGMYVAHDVRNGNQRQGRAVAACSSHAWTAMPPSSAIHEQQHAAVLAPAAWTFLVCKQ